MLNTHSRSCKRTHSGPKHTRELAVHLLKEPLALEAAPTCWHRQLRWLQRRCSAHNGGCRDTALEGRRFGKCHLPAAAIRAQASAMSELLRHTAASMDISAPSQPLKRNSAFAAARPAVGTLHASESAPWQAWSVASASTCSLYLYRLPAIRWPTQRVDGDRSACYIPILFALDFDGKVFSVFRSERTSRCRPYRLPGGGRGHVAVYHRPANPSIFRHEERTHTKSAVREQETQFDS